MTDEANELATNLFYRLHATISFHGSDKARERQFQDDIATLAHALAEARGEGLEEAVYAKQQIAFMVKELSVAIDQNKVSDGDATDELRGMMHEWENFVDLEWAIFKKEILDYPAHTQGTDGT